MKAFIVAAIASSATAEGALVITNLILSGGAVSADNLLVLAGSLIFAFLVCLSFVLFGGVTFGLLLDRLIPASMTKLPFLLTGAVTGAVACAVLCAALLQPLLALIYLPAGAAAGLAAALVWWSIVRAPMSIPPVHDLHSSTQGNLRG